MLTAVEATIEVNGEVRWLEPVHVTHPCRAIVTIIEEPEIGETALLSQQTLTQDWERPEEDAAWSHVQ